MENSTIAGIQQFGDDLYLISLPIPIKGFDRFIGAWFYAGDPLVLVDVGPAVAAPSLLSALADIGRGSPELILLTHIHIDHAGGIGRIAGAFPNAKVVCHPKGLDHLIHPKRLWEGSLKILGDIARAYEPIVPLAAGQVLEIAQLKDRRIQCIETPGHAVHHVSYMVEDLLFAGEAAGVCLPMPHGALYLRPATPPRFFLEAGLESIDRLVSKNPAQICYGHISHRDDAMEMLGIYRSQLLDWLGMIRPYHQDAEDKPSAIRACIEHLLAQDPLLKGFACLETDHQERERSFLYNSVDGYWGYLSKALAS
jgi:glyoxylase-like metal-dependent hydrolase (beta-lactamase superfamily II)